MSVAVITGSAGLVGSESTRYFSSLGLQVVGIDNDMRACYFGQDASTSNQRQRLQSEIANYRHESVDIRDEQAIRKIFAYYNKDISLIIHTAAQPSHDWAAQQPLTDFTVNALGTLVLLEAARHFAPRAVFIFTSTNKVYGDLPNHLPLVELDKRWEIATGHEYENGIPETLSIDMSLHSLFGASKASADLLVQEYGRYFGMNTVSFRGGCLTGPNHSGTQLHGFLAYLMRCAVSRTQYTVFGYKGKQVRDNIHCFDLVKAFDEFSKAPRPGEVYNIGGSRFSNCSMLEAIEICEELTGRTMDWKYVQNNRKGDHIWYVSDVTKFKSHYPNWTFRHDIRSILSEIYEQNVDQWEQTKAAVV
jgi:CDP-paratose 2-epimerase